MVEKEWVLIKYNSVTKRERKRESDKEIGKEEKGMVKERRNGNMVTQDDGNGKTRGRKQIVIANPFFFVCV